MKIKTFVFLALFVLLSFPVFAENIQFLNLHKGRNEVTFSIKNRWINDIDVQINFAVEKIPSWLQIDGINHKITIPKENDGSKKLILIFDVKEPLSDTKTEIPYTFQDTNGNIWNNTLEITVTSNEKADSPIENALYENFPNPFNPSTTIKYSISEERHVKLFIYNSLGQEIQTLVSELKKPGQYSVQWNGLNNQGHKVSTGIYFYRLITGSFIQTRKMMFIE